MSRSYMTSSPFMMATFMSVCHSSVSGAMSQIVYLMSVLPMSSANTEKLETAVTYSEGSRIPMDLQPLKTVILIDVALPGIGSLIVTYRRVASLDRVTGIALSVSAETLMVKNCEKVSRTLSHVIDSDDTVAPVPAEATKCSLCVPYGNDNVGLLQSVSSRVWWSVLVIVPSTSSKTQISVRSLILDVSARVNSLAESRKLTGVEPSGICAS